MTTTAAIPGRGRRSLRKGASIFVFGPRPAEQVVVVRRGPGDYEDEFELEPEGDGYFSRTLPTSMPGTRYRFRLDGEDTLYPDPASRFQPEGPHGPSQVIDPWAYRWSDMNWKGVALPGQVIYEMHIGTFTQGRHLGRRRARVAGAGRGGHHLPGSDADRRIPRPVRLGLRRRQPVRADAAVRRHRTTSAGSSTGPTSSVSA